MLLLPFRELTPRPLFLGFNGCLTLGLPYRRLPVERVVLPAWFLANIAQAKAEVTHTSEASTSLRTTIHREDQPDRVFESYRPEERRHKAMSELALRRSRVVREDDDDDEDGFDSFSSSRLATRTLSRPPAPSTSKPVLQHETEAETGASEPKTLPRVAQVSTPLVRTVESSPFDDDLPPPPRPVAVPSRSAPDPRTIFRNPPKAQVDTALPRMERTRGPRISEVPIADILVVPLTPTFRASEQGVRSLINYFKVAQLLTVTGEKVEEEYTEIYLGPDLFSHQLFMDHGAAPSGLPCVAKGRMVLSSQRLDTRFGPKQSYFLRLELIGCRFERLTEAVLARMHSILYLKPQQHAVSHLPEHLSF